MNLSIHRLLTAAIFLISNVFEPWGETGRDTVTAHEKHVSASKKDPPPHPDLFFWGESFKGFFRRQGNAGVQVLFWFFLDISWLCFLPVLKARGRRHRAYLAGSVFKLVSRMWKKGQKFEPKKLMGLWSFSQGFLLSTDVIVCVLSCVSCSAPLWPLCCLIVDCHKSALRLTLWPAQTTISQPGGQNHWRMDPVYWSPWEVQYIRVSFLS